MPNTKPDASDNGETEIDIEQLIEDTAPAEADQDIDAEAEEAPIDRTAELEAENAALKDQLLRALAETENLRRRSIREKEDAAKYAATNFARDLLSVGDNLRRALESVPEGATENHENLKNLMVGVEMTEREMRTAFEKNGIKTIEAVGQKFDPNLHQAMFEVEDATIVAGTVVQQMQPGYTLRDRLLRPAMVGIAKGGPKEAPAAEQPTETESAINTDPYAKNGDAEPGAKVDTQT